MVSTRTLLVSCVMGLTLILTGCQTALIGRPIDCSTIHTKQVKVNPYIWAVTTDWLKHRKAPLTVNDPKKGVLETDWYYGHGTRDKTIYHVLSGPTDLDRLYIDTIHQKKRADGKWVTFEYNDEDARTQVKHAIIEGARRVQSDCKMK